jgi:hypothetical protein
MQDRRKLQRFDLALASSVEILDALAETAKDPFKCFTRDVSSGGAYFPTTRPLSEGTRVRVQMFLNAGNTLPDPVSAEIRATGYVVRTEPSGMAVCFNGRCNILSPNGN